MDRRRFLRSAGWVAVGGLVATTAARPGVWARPAWAESGPVRVYVMVIDGLRPERIDPVRTPFLLELAGQGTFWPDGRAEMIAETTPNHVAMLTGMLSARHGMPGNSVPGRAGFNPRVGDNPRYLKGDTIFTVARRQAPELTTAAVVSKEYLVHMSEHDRDGDGEPDASHVYQPRVYIPESDHETDNLVIEEVYRVTSELDPDFLFANLGDVDRVGHVDASSWGSAHQAQLWYEERINNVDTLLRLHVEQLKQEGKWDSTVYIVTADHNMDWSMPDRIVNLHPRFQDDDLLRDEVVIGLNGGAAMYALRHPEEPRALERLTRMREIAMATEGVRSAHYTRPNPLDGGQEHWVGSAHPEWGLAGDRTGDLVVEVEEGWRATETGQTSNPIPGNHGHVTTLPIPVIVSGGWDGLVRDQVIGEPDGQDPDVHDPATARNIDIAPTAAWLLGLGPPRGGFDGRVLEEAFTARPPAATPVTGGTGGPHLHRHAGPTPEATSAAVSQVAFDDGAPTVTIVSADAPLEGLAAVPLAVGHGGPVLLGRRDGLADVVVDEVVRLGAERALLVGGEDALGPGVADDLEGAGIERDGIRRVAGEDRYDTARLIAEEIGATHGEAVLVAADTNPGAGPVAAVPLGPVAAAAGRPVLLTGAGGLPETTWAAIDTAGVERLIIAGGEGEVSATVESELRDAGLLVERVGAGDRFETGRLIAERGVREAGLVDVVWVVGGDDLAGGLVAAAAAGAGSFHLDEEEDDDGGPFWFMEAGGAESAPSALVLAPAGRLADGPGAERYLAERRDGFVHVRLVGDASVLSADVQRDIADLVGAVDDPDVPDPAPEPAPSDDDPDEAPLPATGGGTAAAGAALLGAGALARHRRGDGSGREVDEERGAGGRGADPTV